MVLAVVHASGEGVSSVTRHVVREHEHDVRVGYPQPPHGVVDGEGVGNVAVVEPEARRAHLINHGVIKIKDTAYIFLAKTIFDVNISYQTTAAQKIRQL